MVYEGVGSDAFGEECSLLDDKGASWLQLRIATELSKTVADFLARYAVGFGRTGIPAECTGGNSRHGKLILYSN